MLVSVHLRSQLNRRVEVALGHTGGWSARDRASQQQLLPAALRAPVCMCQGTKGAGRDGTTRPPSHVHASAAMRVCLRVLPIALCMCVCVTCMLVRTCPCCQVERDDMLSSLREVESSMREHAGAHRTGRQTGSVSACACAMCTQLLAPHCAHLQA